MGRPQAPLAQGEFHLHNEVGIKFPPLRPASSDGELFFGRFRALVSRRSGSSNIGEGGTGRIHLVRDELMEREVALKIPLESILRDPAAREDVIQETRQAMDLTHPNIVRIHDFHEEGGRWGIFMQYLRGKNLDEWRYENETTGFRRAIWPYAVEAIRDWIAQLCDALRYAHEDARMVHRDAKPKNLMLEKRDGGEKVYISDFGISQRLRQHTPTLSHDQSKAGDNKSNMSTLPCMPWEQIAGAPASPLDRPGRCRLRGQRRDRPEFPQLADPGDDKARRQAPLHAARHRSTQGQGRRGHSRRVQNLGRGACRPSVANARQRARRGSGL